MISGGTVNVFGKGGPILAAKISPGSQIRSVQRRRNMFDTGGAKLKMYKLSKINALNYGSYTFFADVQEHSKNLKVRPGF